MSLPQEFNKIYFFYNERGNLELLFLNDKKKEALIFDGSNFSYKKNISSVPKGFEEADYSKESNGEPIVVESIRQADDITFLKLKNGDIFQIYSLLENSDAGQNLTIYKEDKDKKVYTPLGISEYYAALDRYESAEEYLLEKGE